MPSFIKVRTLYASCLERVFHALHQAVERSGSLETLRSLIQSTLHAGIREHLLQVATLHIRKGRIYHFRSDVFTLLELLLILMDKTTTKLDHSNVEPFLCMDQCAGLYSSLEQCNATGLHELTVKEMPKVPAEHEWCVVLSAQAGVLKFPLESGLKAFIKYMRLVALDPRKANLESVSAANVTFHRVLRNGLASSLQRLVLRTVCDNEILRLLGQHCTHLYYLDVTSSWLVDDGGLKQLCFRDSNWADYFDIHSDMSVDVTALNVCCQTLQEVRIQDTNTSEIGVGILLLLIPKLKSLGGFIYYRNVGDAILSVRGSHPKLQLNLTQLSDTSLPPEKVAQLAVCTPHLSSLYTRGSWMSSVTHFPAITSITIDFDFADYSPLLEEYLMFRGSQLKELVIVDQNHPVDLLMLAELCPSLEQLGAKLYQNSNDNAMIQPFLPNLTVARIRISTTEPLISLLGQASKLQHLEVKLEEEYYGRSVDIFDDAVVSQALTITGAHSLTAFFMLNDCHFSVEAARALMVACPSLKRIGDLQHWNFVHDCDVEELALEVQHSNYDFRIRYRGKWYPPERHFCMSQVL